MFEIEQRRVFNRVSDQDRVKIPKSLFEEVKESKGAVKMIEINLLKNEDDEEDTKAN